MKKLTIQFAVLLLFIIALSACSSEKGDESKTKEDGKINVYTTVYPLQFFAEQIGGNNVKVKTIYPPGADEHTFEPSQRDMMELADSDLFFYIGMGLEGFVEKSKGTLEKENVKLISLGEKIDFAVEPESGNHDEEAHDADKEELHHHGDVDPHVWLDPVYSKDLARAIKEALIKQKPDQEALFEKNYEKLSNDLDKLDTKYKETIHSAKHQKMIVTHAAFGYWEQRYGLKQISISGLSTANEPSQKQLEQIIKTADREGLRYILFEQNVTSKLGEIVEKEIKAKPLQLHNLSILTEKDLSNKETYFTLMNKNLESLKKALNE